VLQNSILNNLSFLLTDEEDNQLDLHSGTATIIQLKFRKMPLFEETLNVRITSDKTDLYSDNKTNSFKVRLPYPLNLTKEWKVALTNINYPTYFSTFPKEEDLRTILYEGSGTGHDWTTKSERNLTFPANIIYSATEIVAMLNNQLKTMNMGFVEYRLDSLTITFNKLYTHERIFINNDILNMLGYDGHKDDGLVTKFLLGEEDQDEMCIKYYKVPTTQVDEQGNNVPIILKRNVLTFNKPINTRYFHPQYFMIYANFIGSTIIGDSYQKILKIFPVSYHTSDHIIKEFKTKDYCDLQNTEVKDIEIEIRGHDGKLINFINISNIIMNLEFTNNPN